MPGRRKPTMDIRELMLQLRKQQSDRAVAGNLQIHRQTVKHYRAWAKAQGLLDDGRQSDRSLAGARSERCYLASWKRA